MSAACLLTLPLERLRGAYSAKMSEGWRRFREARSGDLFANDPEVTGSNRLPKATIGYQKQLTATLADAAEAVIVGGSGGAGNALACWPALKFAAPSTMSLYANRARVGGW